MSEIRLYVEGHPPNIPKPEDETGHRASLCPMSRQREHRIDWAFPRRDIRPGHEGRSATTGVADELVGRLLRLAAGRRILRKERSFCGSFDVNFCPSADSSAPPIPSRRARLRLEPPRDHLPRLIASGATGETLPVPRPAPSRRRARLPFPWSALQMSWRGGYVSPLVPAGTWDCPAR